MTFYLLDVATYQGSLSAADVARAGFSAVNLKISHGLSQKSVHPDVAGWVARAETAGLAVSTFHYLDGSAGGAAQANYACDRMAELGLAVGTPHQVDCESTATLAILRDYLTTAQARLGRPVIVYTGDWWWVPKGWNVSDLTPYVWAAPNAGYPGSYPGDSSGAWTAGYGGWPTLAIMQYAVGPLIFPDGSRGTIDVSKSAVRDPAVWTALTGARGQNMTFAPESCLEVRREFQRHTDLSNAELGIVGDDNHAQTASSYHLGKSANKPSSYSIVESSRDKNGLSEAASANDIGYFEITVGGKKHTLRTFSVWLVGQCAAKASDCRDIREVIYSPDGKTVKRWDALGIRSTGDTSHLSHTHISWFRDSENHDRAAVIRRYFKEILMATLDAEDRTWLSNTMLAQAKAALTAQRSDLAKAAWLDYRFPGTEDPTDPGKYQRNAFDMLADSWFLQMYGTTRGGSPAPTNGYPAQLLAATAASRAEDAARDAALSAAIEALSNLVTQGGGDVETAALMAKLDEVKATVVSAASAAGADARDKVLGALKRAASAESSSYGG